MSERLSRGPIQVLSNDIPGLNYAFNQIQNEIDEIRGLRGRIILSDRAQVSDPVVSGDAVNLATRDAANVVTSPTGRMTYGTDVVKYTDTNGTDLHGMGNV